MFGLSSFYDILFSVVIAVIIILVGYLIGRLMKYLIEASLKRTGFDNWLKKFTIGRALDKAGYSASEFFALVTSWFLYAFFILLGFEYIFINLNLGYFSSLILTIMKVYLWGLAKVIIIVIPGFILVDSFVGYIYSTSEIREEEIILSPIAEYLRILLYIVIVIFALDRSGMEVQVLESAMSPIIWGLTAVMIIVSVSIIISRMFKSNKSS
ncbi:hypothetical protein FFONT_1304 [Fervidicoccus fontis Kam940]|uniref:Uncharacterized protein n=1 Tax=Fervidicoccus fontis (strain DSM 19380 / JCM 18336 / VKM B-2539 / Kam940) TaxID=1163730 RepID=I0A2T5_FERFK|nr:hypothetical protein FFONT_1304 [Fervidicoccus fontis Kam940]